MSVAMAIVAARDPGSLPARHARLGARASGGPHCGPSRAEARSREGDTMFTDLTGQELEDYRSAQVEPEDFDGFQDS